MKTLLLAVAFLISNFAFAQAVECRRDIASISDHTLLVMAETRSLGHCTARANDHEGRLWTLFIRRTPPTLASDIPMTQAAIQLREYYAAGLCDLTVN